MSQSEKNAAETDNTRRTAFIVLGLVSALMVAGLVYLATRPSTQSAEPRLEGALRPGAPEFDENRERIVVDFDADEDAVRGERAIGDVVITMNPVIRNFTGKTLSGIELRAAGFDLSGAPIKERYVVAIPSARATQLETNRTVLYPISINFTKDNQPASLKVELTGVKFK